MSVSIEALRAVEPRQVAAWLRANGWTLAESASEQAAFWRKSAGEEGDYEVELPQTPHAATTRGGWASVRHPGRRERPPRRLGVE
ncbi:MAG: hypothetical protein IPO67_26930 [Deltaproteobacteria bacterium]|nr:hypothetical protein [Deltaproteobacteria bacterium]